MFNPCIAVPCFNHRAAVVETLRSLAFLNLPCIVINDGSTDGSREALDAFAAENLWISVYHREINGGKGAAMRDAIRLALDQGFSHLIQLDGDGQHDSTVAPIFLTAAKAHPDDLILGQPRFERSAPLKRRLGREVSNVLLWIQTLSFCGRDVLCGYRCYPIKAHGSVLLSEVRSSRMEFDPEAVVRLYWAGAHVVNIPTKVTYPKDGISHFRYLRDNLMIARLHIELLAGMVLRAPLLLSRRSRGRFPQFSERDTETDFQRGTASPEARSL